MGCLTPALSEAQKRAELLHNPYILRVTQHQARGESELTASPLPSSVLHIQKGTKSDLADCFSGA